ncbi:unnamed protein product [Trichobilharzia szidati]|nr:unnamed protein product [Trichobilharzia szidati]
MNKPCEVDLDIARTSKGPREYIYNLLSKNNPQVINRRYCLPKIKTNPKLYDEEIKKYPAKTMGPPSKYERLPPIINGDGDDDNNELNKKPYDYLKKHSKKPYTTLDALKTAHWKDKCHRQPPIPPVEVKTIMTEDGTQVTVPIKCLKTRRRSINWITHNAIATIIAKPGSRLPPEPRKAIVDTRFGDKYLLANHRTRCGLELFYVYGKEFGKIPRYLKRRKNLIEKTKANLAHYFNEKALQNSDYLLTHTQREQLLNGLKSTWERYNRKYLGLASINDTLKGKAYKLYLEKQLDELKKDVELIEKHEFIFIEAPKETKSRIKDNQSIICA